MKEYLFSSMEGYDSLLKKQKERQCMDDLKENYFRSIDKLVRSLACEVRPEEKKHLEKRLQAVYLGALEAVRQILESGMPKEDIASALLGMKDYLKR